MSSDVLLPASFRGVPFGVKDSKRGLGRRNIIHEFVQRDEPYVEDMGRLPRKFTLEAFVVGRDWKEKAQALEKALEEKGPGSLVHPWVGEVTVSLAGEVSVREGLSVGNLHVVFSIPFVQDSVPDSPTANPNQSAGLSRALVRASRLSSATLNSALQLIRQPSQVLGEFKNHLQATLNTVQSALGGDMGAVGTLLGDAGILSPSGLSALQSGQQLGETLVGQYTAFAQRFTGTKGNDSPAWQKHFGGSGDSHETFAISPQETASVIRQRGNAFLALAITTDTSAQKTSIPSFPSTELSETQKLPSQEVIQQNHASLLRFHREACVIEAAKALGTSTPESRRDAFKLRRIFIQAVEEVLENTPSDAIYESFTDLRAVTVAIMATKALQAPDIVDVVTHITQPSLALSHSHSRDIDLEADLLTRNKVRHPAFVPSGLLEVMRYDKRA